MQPARQLVSVKGISLYPEQDSIVSQFAAESGLGYSAATRFIIQDWARFRRAALVAASFQPVIEGSQDETIHP